MNVMTLQGDPMLLHGQAPSTLSSTFNSVKNTLFGKTGQAATLKTADALSTAVNTGSVPAVKTDLASRISSSAIGRSVSQATNATINTTREIGGVIKNDIMPQKIDKVDSIAIRNRFLGGIVFGGVINGIGGIMKVASGEYSRDQAIQYVVKDTMMGAVGGASFVGGMQAGNLLFGRIIGGVPLSIAAITVGALTTMGVSNLIKSVAPGWDL